MKNKRIFILCLLFISVSSQVCAGIVFIGNQKSTPDALILKDIESIFLGRKKVWSDNRAIKVVILTDHEIFNAFTRDYTGKPKHLFKSYWKRRVFTGKGEPPEGFKTEKEVISYIGRTEGAIGYVSSDAVLINVKRIIITDEEAPK